MVAHFRVETGDVMKALQNLAAEDAPIVTAYALKDIKDAEFSSMASVFDRPTKFTLDALYLKPATKRDLVAKVFFKMGLVRCRRGAISGRRSRAARGCTRPMSGG